MLQCLKDMSLKKARVTFNFKALRLLLAAAASSQLSYEAALTHPFPRSQFEVRESGIYSWRKISVRMCLCMLNFPSFRELGSDS